MKIILRKFDRFSKEFHLTYKGEEKLSTQFGGFLFIISLIIILFNAFMIGNDIFFKVNPTILTSEKYLDDFPTTKINYTNFFIGFSILDRNKRYFDYEPYLKINPYLEIIYFDKMKNLKRKNILFEVTNCTEQFQALNLQPPFTSSVFNYIKCIKDLNTILSGSPTNYPFVFLGFKINFCRNNWTYTFYDDFDKDDKKQIFEKLKNSISSNQLQLNNFKNESNEETNKLINSTISWNFSRGEENLNCKPFNEIKTKIKDLYFNIFYNKIAINSKNHSEPINKQGIMNWFNLGNTIFKELYYHFSYNVISTSDGIIFNEGKHDGVGIGYKEHLTDYTTKDENNEYLLKANIYISNNVQYTNREYIKIQNILANLGGIMNFVFFIFQFIYDPFFNQKSNLKIVNKLFEFEEENIYEFNKVSKNSDLNEITNFNLRKNDIELVKSNFKNSILISNRQNLISGRISKLKFFKDEINQIQDANVLLKEEISKISDNIKKAKQTKNIFKEKKVEQNFTNINNNNKYEININNFIEEKKKENKLQYKNNEIFKSVYFSCFIKNSILKKKNDLLYWASENIFEYTDFLKLMKVHRDMAKLKYLMFNDKQFKSYEFINNPKKYQNGIYHHNLEFAKVFQNEEIKYESVSEIIKYFKARIKDKNLDKIDGKLLEIIDPKIKKIIDLENDY